MYIVYCTCSSITNTSRYFIQYNYIYIYIYADLFVYIGIYLLVTILASTSPKNVSFCSGIIYKVLSHFAVTIIRNKLCVFTVLYSTILKSKKIAHYYFMAILICVSLCACGNRGYLVQKIYLDAQLNCLDIYSIPTIYMYIVHVYMMS